MRMSQSRHTDKSSETDLGSFLRLSKRLKRCTPSRERMQQGDNSEHKPTQERQTETNQLYHVSEDHDAIVGLAANHAPDALRSLRSRTGPRHAECERAGHKTTGQEQGHQTCRMASNVRKSCSLIWNFSAR